MVPRLAEPALASAVDAPNAQLTLESTTKDRMATARLGYQVSDWLLDLKLSGPLSESRETFLADLDGLRGSTSFDFGVGWIRWDPRLDLDKVREVCRAYASAREVGDTSSETCALTDFPQGSEARRKFLEAFEWGTPLVLKARYRFGHKTYDYLDPETLAKRRVTQVNYSLTAAAGVLTDAVDLIVATYRYEEAFRAGTQTQLCQPYGTGGAATCDPVTLGAPRRRQAHVVQAEIRQFFGQQFGLNPRASYEIKDEVWGLELPLYFLRDPERGLNGGVSVGWRSDDRQFILAAFVGEALTLAP